MPLARCCSPIRLFETCTSWSIQRRKRELKEEHMNQRQRSPPMRMHSETLSKMHTDAICYLLQCVRICLLIMVVENRVITSWTIKMTVQFSCSDLFISFVFYIRPFSRAALFSYFELKLSVFIDKSIIKDGSTTCTMLSLLQEQALCKFR